MKDDLQSKMTFDKDNLEADLQGKTPYDGRQPSMEDKPTFDGRLPSIEDTFNGRRPSVEDDPRLKVTLDERRCSIKGSHEMYKLKRIFW